MSYFRYVLILKNIRNENLFFIGLFLLSCGNIESHDATQSNESTSVDKDNKGPVQFIDIEEGVQPGNLTEIGRGDKAIKYIQDQLNQQ